MPHPALAHLDHRPWPLAASPWIMSMVWEDLLFAHWPVPVEILRPLIPAGLEIDRFEGEAWLGIVPFRMTDTRLRGLPAFPGTSTFPELNVRTYVSVGGKPGVWFFSLDAASQLAVRTARTFFHLPYFDARMKVRSERGGIFYESTRTHRGAPAAEFRAGYRPVGESRPAASGTIERWLVERYCLYSADAKGGLWRGEIHHAPWPLQQAEAEIEKNTMAEGHGIALPHVSPLLHFARRLEVVAWRLAAGGL